MMSASRIRRCVPRYSTGISPRSVMFRRYVCEIPASSAAREVVSISSTLLTVTASPRLKRPSKSTTASRAAGGSAVDGAVHEHRDVVAAVEGVLEFLRVLGREAGRHPGSYQCHECILAAAS